MPNFKLKEFEENDNEKSNTKHNLEIKIETESREIEEKAQNNEGNNKIDENINVSIPIENENIELNFNNISKDNEKLDNLKSIPNDIKPEEEQKSDKKSRNTFQLIDNGGMIQTQEKQVVDEDRKDSKKDQGDSKNGRYK